MTDRILVQCLVTGVHYPEEPEVAVDPTDVRYCAREDIIQVTSAQAADLIARGLVRLYRGARFEAAG